MGLTDEGFEAIRRAGYEAGAAAERERLMKVVCVECGRTAQEPGCWTATPAVMPPVHGAMRTRAEYLRCHPEAGEGG